MGRNGARPPDWSHQRRHQHKSSMPSPMRTAARSAFSRRRARSATMPARQRCSTTGPTRNGSSVTAASMPTGSETHSRQRVSSHASRAGDPPTSPSGMTSAATGLAAASRSCSAASRTGDASPPATIAARPSSSSPSPSPPPSSPGCGLRVLTLAGRSSSTIGILENRSPVQLRWDAPGTRIAERGVAWAMSNEGAVATPASPSAATGSGA